MNSKEFIFWLQGYLEGINKDNKTLEEVVEEIQKKTEEVNLEDKVIERIIEKEIEKVPIWPTQPYNPENPLVPPFTITMYGCTPTQYKKMNTPDSGGNQ